MHPTAHQGISRSGDTAPKGIRALELLLSTLILALIWIILAGVDDPSSWIIGAPAVMAAAWSRGRLVQTRSLRVSIPGALRFLIFFVAESFKGGIDVAARVVGPKVRVEPGFFDYRLALDRPAARVFFADMVSLLPGTLSADLDGQIVTVHALDCTLDPAPELARLEQRVAGFFGETLTARAEKAA
jgi:multicomponent Na+:H+ antiporter subunit E